jgi:hypothetical protein
MIAEFLAGVGDRRVWVTGISPCRMEEVVIKRRAHVRKDGVSWEKGDRVVPDWAVLIVAEGDPVWKRLPPVAGGTGVGGVAAGTTPRAAAGGVRTGGVGAVAA